MFIRAILTLTHTTTVVSQHPISYKDEIEIHNKKRPVEDKDFHLAIADQVPSLLFGFEEAKTCYNLQYKKNIRLFIQFNIIHTQYTLHMYLLKQSLSLYLISIKARNPVVGGRVAFISSGFDFCFNRINMAIGQLNLIPTFPSFCYSLYESSPRLFDNQKQKRKSSRK